MLNISTTTDDNIFNALSHNQDKPVNMSGRSPTQDTLREERALSQADVFESSTVEEKRGELRRRAEISLMQPKNALEMVTEMADQEDAGSLRQYLLRDGELRPKDVMRATQVLEALGFSGEEDLDTLATAFFDTMADAEDLSAVMVFKLWKTFHRSGHIPTENSYGRKGHGVPSYPSTRATMEKLALTRKRLWENRRPLASTKADVVNDGWTSPAERVGTSAFGLLHETTIKHQESMMEDPMIEERGKSTEELTPRKTSTGSPAHQRVHPQSQRNSGQRVAFSGASKLPMPTKRRQSGIFNPDALYGRDNEEGNDFSREETLKGNLWSALPDLNTSARDFEEPSAEGAARQKTLREKMIIKAVSELSPFNDVAEDFLVWRDSAVVAFRQAGRGPVLEPDFHNWAVDQGWTSLEIKEADEWAHVILKSALTGCDDALDVFDNAPAGEGSTAFAYLRRHYELLSSNVKEKLRKQIGNFKPIAGEDPLRMISRINKLHVKHGKTINPEPQSEEAKIRPSTQQLLQACIAHHKDQDDPSFSVFW
jgi:hypothetical protein